MDQLLRIPLRSKEEDCPHVFYIEAPHEETVRVQSLVGVKVMGTGGSNVA